MPLSADSVNQLSEQTLECNLGSRENATDSVSVTARVSNLVHQGQKLAPVSAEISADGVAPVSVPQAKLPEVTASARLMWDISKTVWHLRKIPVTAMALPRSRVVGH